jgi:hypothetical protein
VVRACAAQYREGHGLSGREDRVLRAIAACRTEAMGGHITACDSCGTEHYCYHSCRNRHCPKCQTHAKEQWLARQRAQLLPVPYFHVVFTLPHALNPIMRANPKLLYDLLFATSAQTLQTFAENPKWLGGEMSFTLVLHTWSQTLDHHVHVHGLVSGGALRPDGAWVHAKTGFLFPVQALSRVFRGKYLDALGALRKNPSLSLPEALASPAAWLAFVKTLRVHDWVVYLKPPLAGPEQVLEYLARYTHRVAISNERLICANANEVRFRYRAPRGSATHEKKVLTLPAAEFLRRFLLHVLPSGFKRIRHFGLSANRNRARRLAAARAALKAPPPTVVTESPDAFLLRVSGIDPTLCRHCQNGRLILLRHLPRPTRLPQVRATGPPVPS